MRKFWFSFSPECSLAPLVLVQLGDDSGLRGPQHVVAGQVQGPVEVAHRQAQPQHAVRQVHRPLGRLQRLHAAAQPQHCADTASAQTQQQHRHRHSSWSSCSGRDTHTSCSGSCGPPDGPTCEGAPRRSLLSAGWSPAGRRRTGQPCSQQQKMTLMMILIEKKTFIA